MDGNMLSHPSSTRTVKFVVFQFWRPSPCFSVEVSCDSASSGVRQQEAPQSLSLMVPMKEVRVSWQMH